MTSNFRIAPTTYCPACHSGHVPVDAALGFSARRLTQAAEELATLAGTVASFADGAREVPAQDVRAATRASRPWSGPPRRLASGSAKLLDDGHTLGKDADWQWNHDAKGQTVAYVSIDATGVGIQGGGATQAEGRMAWVGKIYNPTASRRPRRSPGLIRRRPATWPG